METEGIQPPPFTGLETTMIYNTQAHNYTFTPSKEDDGTEYKCTAGNSFTDRHGKNRPESSPVQLTVYCM